MTARIPVIASVGLWVILATGCLTAQRQEPSPSVRADASAKSPLQGVRGAGVPAFWVRPGYRVDLVAEGIENCRFVEFDDKGTLYLSRPQKGDILALRRRGDRYEVVNTFVSGYPTVHGMHFVDGWLWFTQSGAIHRAQDRDGDGKADEVVTVIPEGSLPRGGGHWWRSILVTDRYIYTSIGDSGNINDEMGTERQKIWRFLKDGTGKTLFASGIRNTEKLRLRPGTQEVWGVDHGSDWFGRTLGERAGFQPVTDFNPPDELNHYEEGKFYGHPFIVGNRVPRIEYQQRQDILELAAKTEPPAWSFGAHWATNGFTFLTQTHFPGHQGDMFVACRGSWNRSVPDGYRIERVLFDPVTGRPYGSLTIVKTLSADNQVLARPVDCAEAPDGSVIFTCDVTNRIYRISWAGQEGKGAGGADEKAR
ncbi:MAG: L-sorbosone dehydrogenase [Armatimonadota bacterium]|nr:MAG: L-sorbosone dehydrogenase [Armatimonadota bacterium]